MPNRYTGNSDYKYGFNGMEKDNEIKGDNNSYDFGARMLDPRIGRWLSVDPLEAKFPSLSPYNFVANTPIIAVDPDGKDIIIITRTQYSQFGYTFSPGKNRWSIGSSTEISITVIKSTEVAFYVQERHVTTALC